MSDNVKVCWITGSYYLRQCTINAIKSDIGKHDLYIYDDISADYLEHQIMCTGLFDDTRLIILKSMPAFASTSSAKSTKRLIKMFDNIPDECLVVVDGAPRRGNIYKHIKKIGKIFEYPQYLKRNNAISWVKERLSKLDKSIDDEAVEVFISAMNEEYGSGYNVDAMHISIKKLCHYIGSKKQVDKFDVIKTLGHNTNFVIWNIFNSIDNRDYEECVSLFNKARALEKTDEDASMKILNMILWRFRLMMFMKGCKSLNISNDDILKKVTELKKNKKQGSDFYISYESDESSDPVYKQTVARNMLFGVFGKASVIDMYNMENILNIFKCVLECLGRIRAGSDVVAVMYNFFMTTCNVLDGETLHYMRT